MRGAWGKSHLVWYGVAVASVLLALLVRWPLHPLLGFQLPYITFYPAILFAAYRGGLGPGLVATGLAAVASVAFLYVPAGGQPLGERWHLVGELLFVAVGVCISALCESLHRMRRRAETEAEERQKVEERLGAILSSIDDHLVSYDREFRYTYVNDKATLALGKSREELLGRCIWDLFPDAVGNPCWEQLHEVMAEQKSARLDFYYEPFGRWYENHIYPTASGVVVFGADVTARKAAEQALRKSEEKFRLAAEAVDGIIYEYESTTRRVDRSRGLREVLGYQPEDVPPTPEAWFDLVHPDDRERVVERFHALLEQREEHLSLEYRVRHEDGHHVTLLDRAVITRDASGRVARVVGCSQDISEIRRAEAALREADRRKDELLATLAHELRNPLSPMQNAVRVLKAKGPRTPDLVRYHDVIERQVRHMARLLDDLLDVGRITQDKIDLRRERASLAEVIGAALETIWPLIQAGRHELSSALPRKPVVLDVDPVRLAQVLSIVLDNAARYTDPGGLIRLSAEVHAGEVEIRIQDTGIGIDAELLPHVFDMFLQSREARARSRGGLGVGLALARRLLELHGGDIEARSDGPGKGTEVVIRLPVVSAELPLVATSDTPSGRGRRIVVADDNTDAAEMLATMLTLMGHDVRTAGDGLRAVEIVNELRPEIVLLDIGMPQMDGHEACRTIRSTPWGESMFLVALTGWGQEEDRQRSRDAGFDRHLVKPVDPEALVKLLESV